MAGEYKSACGCKIHVAQWTAKRKVVTQESCPLHKNAAELLAAAKPLHNFLGQLNDCRYCGVIFYSQHGLDYKAEHKPHCEWARLMSAIAKAEGR